MENLLYYYLVRFYFHQQLDGTINYAGYALNHVRTQAIFSALEEAGLEFAVNYEDQTVRWLIKANRLLQSNAIKRAQKDMMVIRDEWLPGDTHLRIDGRPVILNFDPQYFRYSSEWVEIFSVFEEEPFFHTLDSRMVRSAIGAFNWPPMHLSRDGVLSFNQLKYQLGDFYSRAYWWSSYVASMFPGFHDIYAEVGEGAGYGYIDYNNGETFAYTLEEAFRREPDIIQ